MSPAFIPLAAAWIAPITALRVASVVSISLGLVADGLGERRHVVGVELAGGQRAVPALVAGGVDRVQADVQRDAARRRLGRRRPPGAALGAQGGRRGRARRGRLRPRAVAARVRGEPLDLRGDPHGHVAIALVVRVQLVVPAAVADRAAAVDVGEAAGLARRGSEPDVEPVDHLAGDRLLQRRSVMPRLAIGLPSHLPLLGTA